MHGRNKGLYMHLKDIKSTLENTRLTYLSSSALKSRENLKVKSVRLQTPRQPPTLTSLPWLLPHFEEGSLIELQDGRLQRVENLQTEDFLLGALACPDVRLSCCTVQRICTLEPPPYVCRLLLLLHEPHSQELVDVYMEYPFFVWDRGWSSCCPQRTARLCGLQCRQLSVGDVCLALTPVSAPCLLDSASLEPEIPSGGTDRCEKTLLPPGLQTSPTGESRRPEEGRKRHSSAPN
ncbi:ataxin-1-like [Eucyclogobius newberryi]|uniref:ataxin-1-like n=1 Tax=Eucyclogobius newberryi TaxID=166745 RepID=UPI003B5A21D4